MSSDETDGEAGGKAVACLFDGYLADACLGVVDYLQESYGVFHGKILSGGRLSLSDDESILGLDFPFLTLLDDGALKTPSLRSMPPYV